MYDKNKINILFKNYIFTEDNKFLAQLIEELIPMIDVVLAKWRQHKRFWPDAKQDIQLRLWKNLQNSEINRQRQLINPSSYLFFLLRTYARRVLGSLPPDVFLTSLDEILIQRNESTY